MNYKSGVQYKCKSCKELIATDQKLEKRLDNREPQEKQLAKAIKVIGKQTDIEKYQKAIAATEAAQSKGGRPKTGGIISPSKRDDAKRTDAKRAESAGTNRKYIKPAETIVATRPDLAEKIEQGKLKRCPSCRELIDGQATACKHCGRDVP
jgi:hypothetical protein